MHPVLRRFWAEDLVRLRRSDEPRRVAAVHRRARIDVNPHQIDAVAFALRRLPEGGCILADEVGLGKTIEAGLVIAQRLAEGARRVLLIAPKSLVGQWRQELFQLFGLETRDALPRPGGFDGDGIFLINREAVGSERGHDALRASAPFDLCVIDEAHEVFAGLYKRYASTGDERLEATEAKTAARVKAALGTTPVLLLTATPIQNNLAELWGLVQFVEPTGALLGELNTFREVFCDADDRRIRPGTEAELRERLREVLQRTLRRQAQPFLSRPFVGRQARLFPYAMSEPERALYQDVTRYLLDRDALAFQGNFRQLLVLGFHRRMASSMRALRSSLERIEARLSGASTQWPLDDDDADVPALERLPFAPTEELSRVRSFIARARELEGTTGKLDALATALTFVSRRAAQGQGSDKVVIFTESRVTQQWLAEALIERGDVTPDELTLLSGTNDSPRAQAAFARWNVTRELPPSEAAIRMALVDEFRTRTRLFISTEAGAKGLNLQFCNTVVNYDLPWNPQRIEQRIGRCHRYGQTHDVTVINFLAEGNEAEALTFELLSRKLELFGTVLDASDQVLHHAGGTTGDVLASTVGAELEAELARIYERARTIEAVNEELRALRDRVAAERERFEATRASTEQVLTEVLDETVRARFAHHGHTMGPHLEAFDAELERVLLADGLHPTRGPDGLMVETQGPLHLQHPLVVGAIDRARALNASLPGLVRGVRRDGWGLLLLERLTFESFERFQAIVPIVCLEDGEELSPEQTHAVLQSLEVDVRRVGQPERLRRAEDAGEKTLFLLREQLDVLAQARLETVLAQRARAIEDRRVVLSRRRASELRSLEQAEARRDGARSPQARDEAEALRVKHQAALDELEAALVRLAEGQVPALEKLRQHALERRYTPPHRETLAMVELRFE